MKSKVTKRAGFLAVLFTGISLLLNVVPMLVYIIMGYIKAESAQKTTLTLTIIVAIILLIINLMAKLHLRSVFWVLLIGITVCLSNTTPLLITMAVAVIFDEFIFAPLAKHYREKRRINKEIDRRQ